MTSHIIAVDPGYRSAGLALVSHGKTGRPRKISARAGLDFKGIPRIEWAPRIGGVLIQLCAGVLESPGDALWLCEDWNRHSNFDAAVRLAQVQQCFIDVAASVRAQLVMMHWERWQVPTGVNKAGLAAGRAARDRLKRNPSGYGRPTDEMLEKASKEAGRDARNKAAKRWARANYGLDKDPPDDVAQALCIAGVYINEERAKASQLTF